MVISEFEIKRCERELEKFLEKKRPPVHARKEFDLGYRIENQSVELFEIRPQWDDSEKILQHPFAKATYIKKEKEWKIFCQRQDLKWHSYKPLPSVRSLEEFLAIVSDDAHGCFFG